MSTRGADVVERTVVATSAIPPTTRYIGDGPIMTVARPGTAGILRVVKGQYSGSVVESSVVVPPRASVVVRRAASRRARRSSHSPSTTGRGPLHPPDRRHPPDGRRCRRPSSWSARLRRSVPVIARRSPTQGCSWAATRSATRSSTSCRNGRCAERSLWGSRRVGPDHRTEQRVVPLALRAHGYRRAEEVRTDQLRVAGWTVDSRDWSTARREEDREQRGATTRGRARSSSCTTAAGTATQTVSALPYMIRQLRRRATRSSRSISSRDVAQRPR